VVLLRKSIPQNHNLKTAAELGVMHTLGDIMNYIRFLFLVLMLTSCVSIAPSTTEKATSKITIEHDSFKNQTWIKTPLYLSRQGFTDTFPVQLSLRALYKAEKLSFIQLYVTSSNVTWGFYNSANGEDGMPLGFTKIDGVVDSYAGIVTAEEHFGLEIPYGYLLKMSEKDWSIKVYGKRNEGVFILPKTITQSFVEKIKCFEEKKCM